jgi:dihydroflavonol-4-reductase
MSAVRVFVTGATGFIGGRVARGLRDRGDEVVALVRDPAKADALREIGCELLQGDLASLDAIKAGVEGADAVIHGGAIYQVGIKSSEREAMFDANVRGTARVLDAAIEARVPRIVFISSAVVFGHTRGEVAREDYRRPERDFASYYEETKVLAHEIAEERIARGAPVIIVQPGAVYGPNDHSELGTMIEQAATGKLKAKMLSEGGFCLVHVQDLADGILLALDHGEVGEAYILAGDKLTMGELVDRVSGLAGRKSPRMKMPTPMLKASAPLGPVIGPMLGFPPNLGELVRAGQVTYYADDSKARRELGYTTRPLDEGLRDTIDSL